MTAQRVKELASLIPDHAPYVAGLPTTRILGVEVPEVDKISFCLNDPRFGWNLARSFAQLRLPLPREVYEPSLIRAYHYIRGDRDPLVRDALMFMDGRNLAKKLGLDIHLLEKSMSLEEISQEVGLHPLTLQTYADLFFVFRYRLDDILDMLNFIYPETRRVELHESYMRIESTPMLAMRMTYNWQLDSARKFVGFRDNPLKSGDSMTSTKEFESMIMSNGVYLAQLGGLNQRTAPGIKHSRSILAAIKSSGAEDISDDSVKGLTAVSIAYSLSDTVRQMRASEIQHRNQLSQLEFEKQRDSKVSLNK